MSGFDTQSRNHRQKYESLSYQCEDCGAGTSSCHWKATLKVLQRRGLFIEVRMEGRGSSIHAIVGPQINGSFICIPNYNVGSELAGLDDIFWNKERLTPLIGVVDATTVAQGLSQLAFFTEEKDEKRKA